MLRGMGFDKNTYIYLASGKIYNAEKTMAPLLEMFPNLLTKEKLASPEELAPFKVCSTIYIIYTSEFGFWFSLVVTEVVVVELFFQNGSHRLHGVSS